MATTQSVNFDELLRKVVDYTEKNPIVVASSAAATVLATALVLRSQQLKRDSHDYDAVTGILKIGNASEHTYKEGNQLTEITKYNEKFAGGRSKEGATAVSSEEQITKRKEEYFQMVDEFYDLVTDFYEWGWGQSFHFGPRFHDETFVESIKRTEYYLCSRLGMKQGIRALDVGCGVGGPMRNMAVFSKSQIVGVTLNDYQVKIGNKYNATHGLGGEKPFVDLVDNPYPLMRKGDKIMPVNCYLQQGDFQKLDQLKDSTGNDYVGKFDVAYEIEATCHSPDRYVTFSGVNRCLKLIVTSP